MGTTLSVSKLLWIKELAKMAFPCSCWRRTFENRIERVFRKGRAKIALDLDIGELIRA